MSRIILNEESILKDSMTASKDTDGYCYEKELYLKVAFKSNKEREEMDFILRRNGAEPPLHKYDKECCYCFIVKNEDGHFYSWDVKEIYEEINSPYVRASFDKAKAMLGIKEI